MSTATGADVLIVGGGIAGASVAAFLAPHARVLLLERESQCGYHSTGRSAAQYITTYGPPQVRALTLASRSFFDAPPAGFAAAPILTPRGALTVGFEGQQAPLDEAWALVQSMGGRGERLDADEAQARVPVLRREGLLGAVHEPDSFDMDVDALHQGFLRMLRHAGGQVVTHAEVRAAERRGGRWRLQTAAGAFEAPVLVNAAGAWCDLLAGLAGVAPIGLVPKRRAAFTFAPPAGLSIAGWPLVIGAGHDWYVKPDAGMLLGSPANEDPTSPQDVQPEELDIAWGVHRIEQHTTLAPRPAHTWAGLRSFVPDGELVAGFDPDAEGFFWCAGQGGYGIQTSAAMGMVCAALVRGLAVPEEIVRFGVDAAKLSPERLRR